MIFTHRKLLKRVKRLNVDRTKKKEDITKPLFMTTSKEMTTTTKKQRDEQPIILFLNYE